MLAHLQNIAQMSDSLTLGGARHHFFQKFLRRCLIQHRLRQKLLQLAILVFQRQQTVSGIQNSNLTGMGSWSALLSVWCHALELC